VRKTTGLVGAVAIGSGLIATGAPAYADSTGNNGINVLNGTNVSVLPVQLCLNSLTGILSSVINVGGGAATGSPQTNNCVNAPVVDHPRAVREPSRTTPEPHATGPMSVPAEGRGAALPLAPEPVSVTGHDAVTG
jgi:hypothetical protein